MARVLKPPAVLALDEGTPSVFLAGSIEIGNVEVVCAHYGIPLAADLSELVRGVRERVARTS